MQPDRSVQYVWDLASDPKGNLYAATGPTGQLWRRDGAGKWRPEFGDTLTGAQVVIVADADLHASLAHVSAARKDEDDPYAREIFCAQSAICLCETDDAHPMYIQDFVANLKIRFWACPLRSCDYEVSQRMEKTQDGWRTCGFFEHTKPVRMRH